MPVLYTTNSISNAGTLSKDENQEKLSLKSTSFSSLGVLTITFSKPIEPPDIIKFHERSMAGVEQKPIEHVI